MYEEDSSVFHLPVNAAPTQSYAPVKMEYSGVADTANMSITEKPASVVNSYSNKMSDQALFDELNSVSEEVIRCRNQILSKIC